MSSKLISGGTLISWVAALILFLNNNRPSSFKIEAINGSLRNAPTFLGFLAMLQAAICFLLTVMTPGPVSDNQNGNQQDRTITEEASKRIQVMVLLLYIFLGLYYTITAFFYFQNKLIPLTLWGGIFELITATTIFFLYIELSELTVKEKEGVPSQNKLIARVNLPGDAYRHRIVFLGLAAILIILSILSFIYSPQSPDLPSSPLQTIIRIIVANLSGVTLALVVGRLGSIYINPGTLTLFFLYLYAVIQPFAGWFHEPAVYFIVTSLALPLKVLLWLVFVWAFTSGKLWEYVRAVRDYLESQDEDRKIMQSPPQ
jgi:hypothetical protein